MSWEKEEAEIGVEKRRRKRGRRFFIRGVFLLELKNTIGDKDSFVFVHIKKDG